MKIKMGGWAAKSNRRKIEIHIDKFDTWNCDGTLSHIIYPMLLQLRDTKQGVPNEFADVGGADYESQDSFDFYKESHSDAFDEGCKAWDQVLNKMIWSFEQLTRHDYSEQYHHGKMRWEWLELNPTAGNTGVSDQLYEMKDLNPDQHWLDIAGLELHEERIQEGLNLFGKYFRSLWD